MIQCQNVQKYYGATLVLSSVTFEIGDGEKAGLIGRNGAGKTTLLRLISGSEKPDGGQIAVRKGARIGALAQVPEGRPGQTVYGKLQEAFAGLLRCREDMERLAAEMAAQPAGTKAAEANLRRYGQLLEAYESGGGYEIESQIDRVSAGLGITPEQYKRPFSSLSGGEKTKIGLAVILLQNPDLLVLDEPTNHLDLAAVRWLEEYLREFAGTMVVISHDRYFLDAVTGKTVEIEDGEALSFAGNYTFYKQEKEALLLRQFADYQEQQKKIKQMQEAIKQLIEWGNRSNPPNAGFHRRAASMQKALDRMVRLKKPVLERKSIGLKLEQQDRSGKRALVIEEAAKWFGERVLYQGLNATLFYGDSAVLIGDNGSGKSTLLKCILGQETLDEGSAQAGARVETGYLAQDSTRDSKQDTVLDYFRREAGMETGEARGELARFLFYGADVFKRVADLSGGEWTRLRLALLMRRQPNLMILDEPTNHLDIESREALEEALEEFGGSILAVSHDRYFINKIATRIWELKDGRLTDYAGNYEDYLEQREKRRDILPQEIGGTAGEPAVHIEQSSVPVKQDKSAAQVGPSAAAGQNDARQGDAKAQERKRSASASSLSRLEQAIGETENEVAVIDEEMLKPDISCDDGRLLELQGRREQIQAKLDELYERYFAMLES